MSSRNTTTKTRTDKATLRKALKEQGRELTSTEENVLRMLHGIAEPDSAQLPNHRQLSRDAAGEMQAMELGIASSEEGARLFAKLKIVGKLKKGKK